MRSLRTPSTWLLPTVLFASLGATAAVLRLVQLSLGGRAWSVACAATGAVSVALVAATWWVGPAAVLGELAAIRDAPGVARRDVIAHQVYAAYRRMDRSGLSAIWRRAEAHRVVIAEAALAFDIPTEVMVGIAATESSFVPRRSADGGEGLFQITHVPAAARGRAATLLGLESAAAIRPDDPRHAAHLAAATLDDYRRRMAGDLLLALLAYNIGPNNGGLADVRTQYGARLFAQAQPYLQPLPRGYPIRVLAYALAFRIWRELGEQVPYEREGAADRIQRIGVPGLGVVTGRRDGRAAAIEAGRKGTLFG